MLRIYGHFDLLVGVVVMIVPLVCRSAAVMACSVQGPPMVIQVELVHTTLTKLAPDHEVSSHVYRRDHIVEMNENALNMCCGMPV